MKAFAIVFVLTVLMYAALVGALIKRDALVKLATESPNPLNSAGTMNSQVHRAGRSISSVM